MKAEKKTKKKKGEDDKQYLTEKRCIKKNKKTKELYSYYQENCHKAKNLYNYANYLIRQTYRICRKLADGEILDSYEKAMIYRLNCGIRDYNAGKEENKKLSSITEDNSFVADSAFLCSYLKGTEPYKALPYAFMSQGVVRDLCASWKSFYEGIKKWNSGDRKGMTGRPQAPGYLDKEDGHWKLNITADRVTRDEHGRIILPRRLPQIRLKARHDDFCQIRILAERDVIKVFFSYKQEKEAPVCTGKAMGIDPGVNNLLTICMNTEEEPVIISGRPVKSMNQYYNREMAKLRSSAKTVNGKNMTKKMERLTETRNRKILDYMHKAGSRVVALAAERGVEEILIGHIDGWKQGDFGKKNKPEPSKKPDPDRKRRNQNFVQIPHDKLFDIISYKAALKGIKVRLVDESYTSYTSYLDMEAPEKENHNKKRRITRGMFRSNKGQLINADVNAAYQILIKGGYEIRKPRTVESVHVDKSILSNIG